MPSPGAPVAQRKSTVDEAFSPISTGGKALSANTNSANRNRANSSGSNVHYYDDDDDSYYNLGHNDSGIFVVDEEEDNLNESSGDVLDALAPGERYSRPGQFDLCGSMWKRRGGLGRNVEKNW